jgi:DNA-binding transcriptional ArsR family regulator
MKEKEFRASRLLKELGVPTRYQIVKLLERSPSTVSQIAAELNLAVPAVSHHLHILRAIDVVRYDRNGRNAVYRLKAALVPGVLAIAERCAARLEFKERSRFFNR